MVAVAEEVFVNCYNFNPIMVLKLKKVIFQGILSFKIYY